MIRPELDETALVMNANVHNFQHVSKETSSAIAEMKRQNRVLSLIQVHQGTPFEPETWTFASG